MKWTKRELENKNPNSFSYEEDIDFSNETFPKELNVNSIKNVHVRSSAKYDSYLESLSLEVNITGTMVIPCARTLEPIDYHFETNENVIYSFQDCDFDAIIINGNIIDTFEFIRDCVITSVPLAVYKEGTTSIQKQESNDEIDPRFAKLKDLIK